MEDYLTQLIARNTHRPLDVMPRPVHLFEASVQDAGRDEGQAVAQPPDVRIQTTVSDSNAPSSFTPTGEPFFEDPEVKGLQTKIDNLTELVTSFTQQKGRQRAWEPSLKEIPSKERIKIRTVSEAVMAREAGSVSAPDPQLFRRPASKSENPEMRITPVADRRTTTPNGRLDNIQPAYAQPPLLKPADHSQPAVKPVDDMRRTLTSGQPAPLGTRDETEPIDLKIDRVNGVSQTLVRDPEDEMITRLQDIMADRGSPVPLDPYRNQVNRQQSEKSPEINISIGRIEIEAAAAAPPIQKNPGKPAIMSLDEYLLQRAKEGTNEQ